MRVPSSRTNSGSAARRERSRPGARYGPRPRGRVPRHRRRPVRLHGRRPPGRLDRHDAPRALPEPLPQETRRRTDPRPSTARPRTRLQRRRVETSNASPNGTGALYVVATAPVIWRPVIAGSALLATQGRPVSRSKTTCPWTTRVDACEVIARPAVLWTGAVCAQGVAAGVVPGAESLARDATGACCRGCARRRRTGDGSSASR